MLCVSMIWPSASCSRYEYEPCSTPGRPALKRRGVLAGLDAAPARLDADQPHRGVVDEVVEQADGVAAAADAGDGVVGQAALALEHLRPRLAADDATGSRAPSPG